MVELAEVIRDLRGELERAIVAGDGEALRFELGPIELEVSVAIEVSARAGTKIRFLVMELGAQGNIDHASTQRIKLTLSPRFGPNGITPMVSGSAEEQER